MIIGTHHMYQYLDSYLYTITVVPSARSTLSYCTLSSLSSVIRFADSQVFRSKQVILTPVSEDDYEHEDYIRSIRSDMDRGPMSGIPAILHGGMG